MAQLKHLQMNNLDKKQSSKHKLSARDFFFAITQAEHIALSVRIVQEQNK